MSLIASYLNGFKKKKHIKADIKNKTQIMMWVFFIQRPTKRFDSNWGFGSWSRGSRSTHCALIRFPDQLNRWRVNPERHCEFCILPFLSTQVCFFRLQKEARKGALGSVSGQQQETYRCCIIYFSFSHDQIQFCHLYWFSDGNKGSTTAESERLASLSCFSLQGRLVEQHSFCHGRRKLSIYILKSTVEWGGGGS